MPHVSVKSDVPEPEPPPPPAMPGKAAKKRRMIVMVGGAAAVLVLAGAGFFLLKEEPPPPPPPPKAKSKAAPAAPAANPLAAATTPTPATPGAAPGPATAPAATAPPAGPASVAQIPGAAINAAKNALEVRRANAQAGVEAALTGEDLANRPASVGTAPAPAAAPAPRQAVGMTALAPGLSATAPLEAAVDASPAFRTFVTSAKITGVFQGDPPRAFVNGRLARGGETVDSALGIVFVTYDADRKLLVFRDRTGAVVQRKYP